MIYKGWTILTDCDGTLTNGQKNINEKGERFSISFHARDSIACRELVEMGFQVIIVTHSRFTGIPSYWNRYGAQTFWAAKGDAMKNKIDVASFYTIDWSKTIGIGDDITDLCYLELCKFPYLVPDAHHSLFSTEGIEFPILESKGGEGVLAELYYKITKQEICKAVSMN